MTKLVFIDPKGNLKTQRINQTDCRPTVAWLGMMRPDLELLENIVGSATLAQTSSDIDLVYDRTLASADDLFRMLAEWCMSYDKKPSQYVIKHNNLVFFRCPIAGTPSKGFVQINLYPTNNVAFSREMMRQCADSQYKCRERNQLLNSIAYTAGYKINPLHGLLNTKNRFITHDLDKIAKVVLGNKGTPKDWESTESLLNFIAKDSKRAEKIERFLQHLEREGIPFIDDYYVPDTHFMARLRDRIVNQGMVPLVESARIEHLEDLVFDKGVSGVTNALNIIQQAAEDPSAITPKIDGKICLVWGRKPTGEFVLTDKSGLTAKSYDGLATSVDELAEMMNNRGSGREALIQMFAKIFPMLEASTPKKFRGFVRGDLLFHAKPDEVKGALRFKPNYIEYSIPVDSDLGNKLMDSEVAIAAHSFHESHDSEPQPLSELKHHEVPGLAIVHPSDFAEDGFEANVDLIAEIQAVLEQNADAISLLFNPTDLRAQKITDLPALCKRYINTRIHNDYDELLPRFMVWLKNTVTDRKFRRVIEYLHSPSSNADALSAVFTLFLMLHELKSSTLLQLDRKNPGNEGWVLSTEDGTAKLVDRFNFTAKNKQMWDQKKKGSN